MNDTERDRDRADDQTDGPSQPASGEDSRVEDWFGQSVQLDAELADELADELGEEEAGRRFDDEAVGADEQNDRRGDSIDPDQGTSAYQDDTTDRRSQQ